MNEIIEQYFDVSQMSKHFGEVLDGLYERFEGLRDRIAEDGDLRRFVNVYVGGEDIRFLDGLDTSVEDGDEVTILPAVAGGS